MTLSESDNAILSKGAYYDQGTALDLAKTVHPDFTIDTSLSDKHSTVYHNPTTQHTVVAFRGTKDKQDLITDTFLFFNMAGQTKRFKEANALASQVVEKYGKNNTSLTGHSLGSNIASDVSKKQDLHAVGFSKGRTLLPTTTGKKEKQIRVAGDPVSGYSVLPSAMSAPALLIGKGRKPKKLNPHSIDNFIN